MFEKILQMGQVKQVTPLDYKNPKLSIDERVIDLLNRMTLEEKVAQMLCIRQDKNKILLDEKGNFDFEKAKEHYKQ